MAQSKQDPHEAWVLANATHFTTCVFRGRGRYDVLEHPTLEAARAKAKELLPTTSRGVMVYAVKGIHQGHIENIYPEKKRA